MTPDPDNDLEPDYRKLLDKERAKRAFHAAEQRRCDVRIASLERALENLSSESEAEGKTSSKPDDLPSFPEMVMDVIMQEYRDREVGLSASELFKKVREKFWDDAPYNSVLPTASRLVSKGRIEKVADKYLPSVLERTRIARARVERDEAKASGPLCVGMEDKM